MNFSLVPEFLLAGLIPIAVISAAALLSAQRLIHIFQLESYKRPQFFMHVKEDTQTRRELTRMWILLLLLQVLVFFGFNLVGLGGIVQSAVTSAVFLAGMLVGFVRWKKRPSKKPLKVTARVVRLDVSLFVVLAVFQLLVAVALSALLSLGATGLLTLGSHNIVAIVLLTVLALMLPLISMVVSQLFIVPGLPRFIAVASVAVQPVENAVKNWYFNDAKKKLAGFPGMVRVGITGSYGKTSAKVILSTILSEKYKTYATPHSYNTPMGVTRAIREQLDASYEVFIAEMGARNPGDIAEMCSLASPKYGLITSVGAQHLETFKTVENVAKTKYELIKALPPDGMAFFPSDNEICLNLYKKTNKPKALFGLDGHGEKLSMSARDVSSGPRGSTFALVGPEGETAQCTTKLLGSHNVQNILGAAAVARVMGLSMEEISRGIGKLEPVEHRLQLLPTNNGVTVIDDAFNSNPAGVRAAMEVIKSFPGRKIVVTPGLVELGDAEYAENEAFGRVMALAADIAILVARNAEAMKKGLLEAGFSESRIIVTGKLAEATAVLGKLTQVGDVVLFENDLPDHYET
jgi:UDP-N-acetylmuramoyl-tripeptide--D-alanyl-D-alanine ligase